MARIVAIDARPNPAWAERLLIEYWGAIAARLGPDSLPDVGPGPWPRESLRAAVREHELGCGHYGCVYRTAVPDVVIKLTSDPSEAAFIAAALELPPAEWPAGMIRYEDLFELAGAAYRGRKVYCLARREAQTVGLDLGPLSGTSEAERRAPAAWVRRYGAASIVEGMRWLLLFRDCASRVKQYVGRSKSAERAREAIEKVAALEPWAVGVHGNEPPPEMRRGSGQWSLPSFDYERPKRFRGAEQAALDLRRCETAAEMMETSIHFVSLVGGALGYYLERGMLLADVHLHNVGEALVDRGEGDAGLDVVITDPGHMVPLEARWLEVTVPLVGGGP